jgi:chromate transporter
LKEYFDLLWAFFLIGISTFGGGYSMLPILERELIKKRNWINIDEVMDYYSIAQITPGVIAINISTFVGYKRKGLAGGILATIGFFLPGVCLMIIASFFIKQFSDYGIVSKAFTGIRIAVGALILSTIIKLLKGVKNNFLTIGFFIISFVLSVVFNVSPIYIILGAGLAGFFIFPVRRKTQSTESPQKTGEQ